VQLKFSVLYHATGRGPTVPVDGRGGNWIAKLPSETFANVPEHEYEVIQWAARVGIRVPDVALVTAGEIERLRSRLPRIDTYFSRDASTDPQPEVESIRRILHRWPMSGPLSVTEL
jgi:HipA-like C-terminal domain